MSFGLLKAKGQDDNFFTRDTFFKKDLQKVENLLMTWMEFSNVDHQSLVDAFVRDLGFDLK